MKFLFERINNSKKAKINNYLQRSSIDKVQGSILVKSSMPRRAQGLNEEKSILVKSSMPRRTQKIEESILVGCSKHVDDQAIKKLKK